LFPGCASIVLVNLDTLSFLQEELRSLHAHGQVLHPHGERRFDSLLEILEIMIYPILSGAIIGLGGKQQSAKAIDRLHTHNPMNKEMTSGWSFRISKQKRFEPELLSFCAETVRAGAARGPPGTCLEFGILFNLNILACGWLAQPDQGVRRRSRPGHRVSRQGPSPICSDQPVPTAATPLGACQSSPVDLVTRSEGARLGGAAPSAAPVAAAHRPCLRRRRGGRHAPVGRRLQPCRRRRRGLPTRVTVPVRPSPKAGASSARKPAVKHWSNPAPKSMVKSSRQT
jgi:hypothetical protein